ncbi:MAG: hypothetical protein LBJ69_01355 [Holosporales bacterium]|jgi:hypothetical protein|nr:hypothetical protein [Holosporales bacterium]
MKSKLIGLAVALCVAGVANVHGGTAEVASAQGNNENLERRIVALEALASMPTRHEAQGDVVEEIQQMQSPYTGIQLQIAGLRLQIEHSTNAQLLMQFGLAALSKMDQFSDIYQLWMQILLRNVEEVREGLPPQVAMARLRSGGMCLSPYPDCYGPVATMVVMGTELDGEPTYCYINQQPSRSYTITPRGVTTYNYEDKARPIQSVDTRRWKEVHRAAAITGDHPGSCETDERIKGYLGEAEYAELQQVYGTQPGDMMAAVLCIINQIEKNAGRRYWVTRTDAEQRVHMEDMRPAKGEALDCDAYIQYQREDLPV